MNLLLWGLLCLFGVIGLAQCISWVADGVRRGPKKIGGGYYVIPLYEDPAQLEAQLRLGVSRLRWNSDCADTVLFVDLGLGEESRKLCDHFIRENPGLAVCTGEGLLSAICDLEDCTTIRIGI